MADLKLWGDFALERLRRDMDGLFDALCADYGLPPLFLPGGLRLRVVERAHCVVVTTSLSGFSPEDIAVAASPRTLTISGKRGARTPDGIDARAFRREIALPAAVDPAAARIDFSPQTLTVTLPKRPHAARDVRTGRETL